MRSATRRPLARSLAGVDAAAITSRAALATLPVMRKHELLERQKAARASRQAIRSAASRPSAGAHRARLRRAQRVFQSPGPIYEPEGTASDYWRMARALFAAGFRAGDLVHNSFSYHLTPAGLDDGDRRARARLHRVSRRRRQHRAAVAGDGRPAPAGLRRHAELPEASWSRRPPRAASAIASLQQGPGRRRGLSASAARLAASSAASQAYQSYATADVGLIAYETAAREGLVLDEGVIVEIVRPGTGEPVADGEVGEVVVTALNPDYPLVRFGTGDLSAVLPGRCPTGRTNTRIKGWLGRADQTAKVRGMFVHPSQVAEVAAAATPRSAARGWWSKARWPTTA